MPTSAAAATRGVIYITLAKAYFMVAGYAIVFILPRLLGDVARWGEYTVVVALASVIDNVIVTGTIQGVSRFTAHGSQFVQSVKRTALRVQALLGGGVALAYFALAPWIAAWERDPGLTAFYRVSAGIVLCYAFYSVFIGSLNGQQRFGTQAAFDAGFATLRAVLILGCAAFGLGVLGSIGGFVAAAALILGTAAAVVGLPRPGGEPFAARQLWRFMLQLFAYNASINLVLRADLFLLKRFSGRLATGAEDPSTVASMVAGYYGSAQQLAFIPYQAILSIAFVIFPLVSRATFDDDRAQTQRYIRQTLRACLIIVGAVAVTLIANPPAMMSLPFPTDYRIAGPALRILAAGMIAFSLFVIINTILSGAGRAHLAIVNGGATLVAVIVANIVWVPQSSSQAQALVRAASATASAMWLGAAVAGLVLWREFRAGLPILRLVRVAFAVLVAAMVASAVPELSRLVTLMECGLVVAVFVLVLFVTGELAISDLRLLLSVVRRGTAEPQ